MEMISKKFDSPFSSCDDGGKILIEDDGKNGGGKGRVGEIIHRPTKNLSLLNWHGFLEDQIGRWGDEELGRISIKDFTPSPYHPISSSFSTQTVLISCRIKTR